VFFLGHGAVFGSRHWFAGFVDVAGPAVPIGVLGGGFGDLGVAVAFGFAFEEGSGFFADRHCWGFGRRVGWWWSHNYRYEWVVSCANEVTFGTGVEGGGEGEDNV